MGQYANAVIEMNATVCTTCGLVVHTWFQTDEERNTKFVCKECINNSTEVPNPSNPTTEGNTEHKGDNAL
jgi:predicted RNA-binding Zn-ribbon protein involved in translation (DUF1610 family)